MAQIDDLRLCELSRGLPAGWAALGVPGEIKRYEVAHLYEYLAELQDRGASPGYQHRRYREVTTCFSWFKRRGFVGKNVFAKVPLLKQPQKTRPPSVP